MKQNMKTLVKYICLLVAVFSLSMCTSEEIWDMPETGADALASFDFAHCSSDEVEITTRATLDIRQESRILNMFVYVFASDGQRIYSHFFSLS